MVSLRELITCQVLSIGEPTSKRAKDTLHAINGLAQTLAIQEYYRNLARRKAREHKQVERRALCTA